MLFEMSVIASFPIELRDWIEHNLTRGIEPQAIVHELVERKTAPELAVTMVNAVSSAILHGIPLPGPTIEVGSSPIAYEPEPLRVPDSAMILLGDRRVQVIARLRRPVALLMDNFLDVEECTALIELAKPRLQHSTIVDPVTGSNIVAGHRSSDGMFFQLGETPLIERIEARIAALTGLPIENGEGLQLLHYEIGAESTPHVDYLMTRNRANSESIERSGQRVGTLLMYLNDVEAGGETVFPQIGWSVTPRRGQALYFEYGNSLGYCDPSSLHAGNPVRAGHKWLATKWIRSRRFIPRNAS